MEIGTPVPQVQFMTRVRDDSIDGPNPYRWEPRTSNDYFAGRRVLVFSLPGAFTPTCSTYQLPGFEEQYNHILEQGIDEIYCMSVNDAFVMNKWAKDQCIERVKVIPDGNGEFTDGMGMLVDMSVVGFGKRSRRYAFVAKDGVVEKLFVEPESTEDNPDPYGETSPETVIAYLESKQEII